MGIRTRRARKHANTHAVGFGIAGFFGFMALFALALALSLGAAVSSWLENLPDYNSADAYLVAEPTRVYDSKGNDIADFYLQQRHSVTLDQISPYVIQGTIDTEDKRFYSHGAIDPWGIARASVGSLFGGGEGASTITQQVVRNTVLSNEQFEISLKRKVREAYISIQMEKKFTKDQILNMYLNTIYYGNGAYGIEAASIIYFNKHASDLTLAEAATLAGLPNAPSAYDPTVNPEAAKERRNTVLERMHREGHITDDQYNEAVAEDLVLNPGTLTDSVGQFPYWTDYIRSLLQEDFDSDTILQGGLRVYTTLDPDLQKDADEAARRRIAELGNPRLGAALVSIDPQTGYIKAMVGGQDYSKSQYNIATSSNRQMGSSFKMYTLVAALSEGMNPEIVLNGNSPMQITPTWLVRNAGNYSYGAITLRQGTVYSSNTVYAQVAEAIGIDKILQTCYAMGIRTQLQPYLSTTLGSQGVTPIEQCTAFATLAAGGVRRDAVAITRIEDRNGNVIYEHKDNPVQAISPAVAAAATDVLSGVLTSGTGRYAYNLKTFNQPVAGKTGTSDNSEDLWFCAYTPQLATVAWCGYPDSRDPVIIGGGESSTFVTAQYVWAYYMNAALAGVSRAEFPKTTEKISYKPDSYWKFVGGSASAKQKESTTTTTNNNNNDEEEEETTDEEEEDNSTTTPTTPTTPATPGTGAGTGAGAGAGAGTGTP